MHSSMAQQEVVHAYRQLYRQGLKAIRYATPARHVLRSSLRDSFRSCPREEFDSSRVFNTIRFLERATEYTGYEHKILRNLLLIKYWAMPNIAKESRVLKVLGLANAEDRLRKNAYEHYYLTLERLNESIGTCLK
ncbi:hypothetical protein N7495_001828 [Penicillium taxi]|uniref:uncharacterized protein n=1 Tax=Penicillium taxi TaxID=168475 RepID=UPI002545790E|nr:uncharacterized protein N7495_001828 [Penicillium taxi]KAJ5909146.1 hypothetical protein N7495_001828 [Penicillium taxi]